MTPDQAALVQRARESVKAARALREMGFHNFSVSRSYYAMFYLAQALLLEEDLAFSKHSGVIAAFGSRFAKTGRVPAEFHRYLIEGQDSRNVGDYDIHSDVTGADADEQLRRAEEFVGLAERELEA